MEWSALAGQLAQIGLPALGTLLGGPLGGTVGSVVGKAIAAALHVPAKPEAVADVIAADPVSAQKVLAEIEAETTRQQAVLNDLASARQMETVAIEREHGVAWVPVIITGLVYALVAAIMVSVAMGWLREDGILVGWVLGVATSSTNFWFGTTDASRRKDSTLSRVATSAVTPPPGLVALQAAKK